MERCYLIAKEGDKETWAICGVTTMYRRFLFFKYRRFEGCQHYDGPAFLWGWGNSGG